ncbi:unnamed protein product [Prunus armeniaca]
MVPLKTQFFLNTEGVALKNFPRHSPASEHFEFIGQNFNEGHVLEGYLEYNKCWKDIWNRIGAGNDFVWHGIGAGKNVTWLGMISLDLDNLMVELNQDIA